VIEIRKKTDLKGP